MKKNMITNVVYTMLYDVEEVLDRHKLALYLCWLSEVAVLMYLLISQTLLQIR